MLVALAAVVVLSGCFTTTADFQSDAEEFIRTNAGIREALGTTMVEATCEEPPSRDVGTTFPCSAVDEEDRDWEFVVEITGESSYEVDIDRFPGSVTPGTDA